MQDYDGIELALKDIRSIALIENQRHTKPLISELKKQASLTLQDRSLLAALLDLDGQTSEAEKLLNGAPAEHSLIALAHLSQIYQSHTNWPKAAQALQRTLDLPGGRTSTTLQKLVDLHRRALQHTQALKYLAEWKIFSPTAVQPWLTEARILEETFHPAESLKVLRQAQRKFPDATEVATACAAACLNVGDAAEAERIYLAIYEKTTDPASRIRQLGPLAHAARSHDALPKLIENFTKRQKQNRVSAFPWLALAEIHRATDNDEERRRCLYEASRLRPQDLTLLLEIARSEEDVRLFPEALRTLETAAKLDKTTRTRERIARLQMEHGDSEAGYRMLFELASSSTMDPREIEQIANVLAGKDDWEHVIEFLDPLLEKYPTDYRLHYLHAVALEEIGREAAAVQAFMKVLAMHEELPVPPPAPAPVPQQSSNTLTLSINVQDAPPGTMDWLLLPDIARAAYQHRTERIRSLHTPGVTFQVSLPANVILSPTYALAHVLQISSAWQEEEQQRLLRQLQREGVSHAPLLMELALQSSDFQVTEEILAAHPQDAALHAAWLLGHPPGEDPILHTTTNHRCFEMFKAAHISLALQAAYDALRAAQTEADAAAWVQRIIACCQPVPRSAGTEWFILKNLLSSLDENPPSGSTPPMVSLSPEQSQAIMTILHRWALAMDISQLQDLDSLCIAFIDFHAWDAAFECLQHMYALARQPNAPTSLRQQISFNQQNTFSALPLALPATSVHLPLLLSPILTDFIERIQRSFDNSDEEQIRFIASFQAAMQPRLATISDPPLKFMLTMICGKGDELLADLQPRLNSPAATAEDFLIAGWICQETRQHAAAVAHFQQAQKLITSNDLRLRTVNAVLFNAQKLLQSNEASLAAKGHTILRSALEFALPFATNRQEKESLAGLMAEHGMEAESAKLVQSLPNAAVPLKAQSTAAILNPYARALLQQRSGDAFDALERLFMQSNPSGALHEARRLMRLYVAEWHKPAQQRSAQTVGDLRLLLERLEVQHLRAPLLLAIKNAATSSWQQRMDYAATLCLLHADHLVFPNNDGDRTLSAEELLSHAITEYTAVLAANPQVYVARHRLILLLVGSDPAAALKHWLALPPAQQPDVLYDLNDQPASVDGKETMVKAVAHARLVSQWLKNIDPTNPSFARSPDAISEILFQVQRGGQDYPGLWEIISKDTVSKSSHPDWEFDDVGMLILSEEDRRSRHERRLAHDTLCHAMVSIPAFAREGFAPLAGLSMLEGRNVEEVEKIALHILASQASPQLRRQFNAPQTSAAQIAEINSRFQSSDQIASPTPAIFATWSAAQRGDSRALDEEVFPAILKAEGQTMLDFCRGYAAVIMAPDQDFPSTSSAWLRSWSRHPLAFGDRGICREIVRLWRARRISAPLDDLFIEHRALALPNILTSASSSEKNALDDYVRALVHREPEALPRFIRRMREVLVSPDASVRRQLMAKVHQKSQRGSSYHFSSAERTAFQYKAWLQRLIDDGRGCFAALELALDDGMVDSLDWLDRAGSSEFLDRIQTPSDFTRFSRVLGFLPHPEVPHPFGTARFRQQSLMTSLATYFRDEQKDEVVQATLAQLGAEPSSLPADLLQAMLVRTDVTTLHLDGSPVQIPAATPDSSRELSLSAFHLVVVRHAAAIAALSPEERQNLGSFLSTHLPGFPKIEIADEAFTRAVAPILQAQADGLRRQADAMLACKTWEEFDREQSQPFTLIQFLLKYSAVDPPRSTAVAHHALDLMRATKSQRAAIAAGQHDTPTGNLILALAQVPPLLGTSLSIAEDDGLGQSLGWSSMLSFHFHEALKNSDTLFCVFQDTPFTAEAPAFRDLRVEDPCEPTILARIINSLDNDRASSEKIKRWLARQPATFGTRLLQALLHRAPADAPDVLSFYDERGRPNDSTILDFIRQHQHDFTLLSPQSAPALLALFQARLPDLQSRIAAEPRLQASLQPLYEADSRQLASAVTDFLQIINLKQARCSAFELMQRAQQLLDRLAPVDKPRAVEVLDHVSKLMATEEILAQTRGKSNAPHLTAVAQWLQFAAVTPELFDDIMQRAAECGAASHPIWVQRALTHIMDIHYLRSKPARFIPLLRAAHMLDSAATFNPWPLPQVNDHETLLELWQPKLQSRTSLVPALTAHQPHTFGVDLLLLLCGQPSDQAVTDFARTYAVEIAAAPPAQQKILAAFFERQPWGKVIAPLLPAPPSER